MENKLAENIRAYRKGLCLTQEQLAERLGITLGTISKWERGSSEPDFGYLMDLAEVFHVSVDALIGFTMRGNDAEAEAERIERIAKAADIEKTKEEYENALKKFPNHFRIVYGAAEAFRQIGVVYRQDAYTRQALDLYRHAIELISQNKDPQINEVILRNEIAGCYASLKDYKRAVEEYKRNNLVGNNDSVIGMTLIQDLKKPDEGIEYTERAFINNITEMIAIMSGYVIYYRDKKNIERGIRAAGWTIHWLKSMKDDPGKGSYLDKMICLYELTRAIGEDLAGRTAGAERSLREAVRIAKDFDAHPIYRLENIVFADHVSVSSVYDNAGPTAIDGLKDVLKEAGDLVSESFREKFEREIG